MRAPRQRHRQVLGVQRVRATRPKGDTNNGKAATTRTNSVTTCSRSTSAPDVPPGQSWPTGPHLRGPRRRHSQMLGIQLRRGARPRRHRLPRGRPRRDGRQPPTDRRRNWANRRHDHGQVRAPRRRHPQVLGRQLQRRARSRRQRPPRRRPRRDGRQPAPSISEAGASRGRPGSATPALYSTAAASSAGGGTLGQLGQGDTTTAATPRERWATTSHRSTSEMGESPTVSGQRLPHVRGL